MYTWVNSLHWRMDLRTEQLLFWSYGEVIAYSPQLPYWDIWVCHTISAIVELIMAALRKSTIQLLNQLNSITLHNTLILAMIQTVLRIHIWSWRKKFYSDLLLTTQKATFPYTDKDSQWTIINTCISFEGKSSLFMLRKSCPIHHHGLIRFQISDRKSATHTTEMILWSMILTMNLLQSEQASETII